MAKFHRGTLRIAEKVGLSSFLYFLAQTCIKIHLKVCLKARQAAALPLEELRIVNYCCLKANSRGAISSNNL